MKSICVMAISSYMIMALLAPGCSQLPPERPSVPSQPDPLTDTVVDSDLIVLGTITDLRYEVVRVGQGDRAGKYAYTIFTLSVEKVIKGDPATKEVFIKAAGGMTGDAWQAPIEAYFSIADKALVCLSSENDNVYKVLHNGMLWVEGSEGPYFILIRNGVRMDFEKWLGEIILIMKANNIPIALPASEWPPLPTGPVRRPEKETIPVPEPPKNSP